MQGQHADALVVDQLVLLRRVGFMSYNPFPPHLRENVLRDPRIPLCALTIPILLSFVPLASPKVATLKRQMPQLWVCRYQAFLLPSNRGNRMSSPSGHRLHYYNASRHVSRARERECNGTNI